MSLLSVDDLVVRFRTRDGTIHAVNGVSFDLDEGERLGLVGESGCGKSVTNLAIMRLLPKPAGRLEGGKVLFDGVDLAKLNESDLRDIRGRDIAMIFQDPMTSLNPVLTIGEQMIETIQAHRKVSGADARARAVQLLSMVGIPRPENRLSDFPHQFSGGMRQRVMIAIALALEPKLLIADEPTTALDVTIQAQVLDLLRNLTTEQGTALILITHDLGVVAGMTQRINVMYAGFIVETASTPDLFEAPSHPYTVGLLHSIPRIDQAEGEELVPIEGRPPDMRRAPTGCPFAPRCAWRLDVCWVDNPPLRSVDGDTRVAVAAGGASASSALSAAAAGSASSSAGDASGDVGGTRRPGGGAVHRIACHNPPTPDERAAGRPLGERYRPAPPPPGMLDELAGERVGDEPGDVGSGGGDGDVSGDPRGGSLPEASTAPSAAGLPIDPTGNGHG